MSQIGESGWLWQYALETYQRPSVAQACLALQDGFSADVNLLLTASWLAARQLAWQSTDVAGLVDLCADWREHCVLPLRALRRYLRSRAGQDDEALAALYRQGKTMELEAERYQLSLIEDVINASPLKRRVLPYPDLLAVNLDVYLQRLGCQDCRPARAALLTALSASN